MVLTPSHILHTPSLRFVHFALWWKYNLLENQNEVLSFIVSLSYKDT